MSASFPMSRLLFYVHTYLTQEVFTLQHKAFAEQRIKHTDFIKGVLVQCFFFSLCICSFLNKTIHFYQFIEAIKMLIFLTIVNRLKHLEV